MANRKLKWWARLTFRKTCGHCGELYATTTLPADGLCPGEPGCEYCAAGYASGRHEDDWDDTLWCDALDALPWLLRHRPNVRQLNCSADSYREVAHDPQARADAFEQLSAEYNAASWPVRYAYNIGQRWDEVRFRAGIIADWARITVTRPNCARCGDKAATTSQLRAGQRRRTPLCDDCCYAINDGAELPRGSR